MKKLLLLIFAIGLMVGCKPLQKYGNVETNKTYSFTTLKHDGVTFKADYDFIFTNTRRNGVEVQVILNGNHIKIDKLSYINHNSLSTTFSDNKGGYYVVYVDKLIIHRNNTKIYK